MRVRREALGRRVAGALGAARALGLEVRPLPGRAAWRAEGEVGGRPVRVEWAEGTLEERTVLRAGGREERVPLVATADELRALLGAAGDADGAASAP